MTWCCSYGNALDLEIYEMVLPMPRQTTTVSLWGLEPNSPLWVILNIKVYMIHQNFASICSLCPITSLVPRVSPCMNEDQKKGESLIKFITWEMSEIELNYMWMNKWTRPHFIDRINLFSSESFMANLNGTRRYYATLPGSTASYGECT